MSTALLSRLPNATVTLQNPPDFKQIDLQAAFPQRSYTPEGQASRWHPRKPKGQERKRLEAQAKNLTSTTDVVRLPAERESIAQTEGDIQTAPSAESWLETVGNLGQKIFSMLPSMGLPVAAGDSSADRVCTADGNCFSYKDLAEVAKAKGGKVASEDIRNLKNPRPASQANRQAGHTSFTTERLIKYVSSSCFVRTTRAFRALTDIRGGVILLSDFHHNPSVQQAFRTVIDIYVGGEDNRNLLMVEAMPDSLADSQVAAQRCFGIPANRCIGMDRHNHDVLAHEWARFMNDVAKNVMTAAHASRDVTAEHNLYDQTFQNGDFFGAQAVVMKLLDERIAKGGKAAKTFKANKKKLENYENRASDEVYKNAPKRNAHFVEKILEHVSPDWAIVATIGAAHTLEVFQMLEMQGQEQGVPVVLITPKEPLIALLNDDQEHTGIKAPPLSALENWAD